MTPEQIALSASHAAWMSAIASSCASVIALSIAIFGARRDEARRLRIAKEQETAFCWAMVGALDIIKPIILESQADPESTFDRKKFNYLLDHARAIAEAGRSINVLEMRLLHDAYQLRGALNLLQMLSEDHAGPIPHSAVLDTLYPSLDRLIEADERFFSRLPPISAMEGVAARTPLSRTWPDSP